MDEIKRAVAADGIWRGTLPKWLIVALRIVGYSVRVTDRQDDLFTVEITQ